MSEENKSNVEILNEDIMMERGKFTANGYTFTVKPVYFDEFNEYSADTDGAPVPKTENEDDEPTEKQLTLWAIALFSDKVNGTKGQKKPGFLKRLFIHFVYRNDYHYYEHLPVAVKVVRWLEKKVTYKGRRVKFYQLERKFGLNKAEIERLIIYFHKLSLPGF